MHFEPILRQIVSIRVKTLSNTNLVASRYIKREKGSLPVDVCRSETSLIKLPILFKRDDDFSLAKIYSSSKSVAFQYLQGYVGQAWCRTVEHTADIYPE